MFKAANPKEQLVRSVLRRHWTVFVFLTAFAVDLAATLLFFLPDETSPGGSEGVSTQQKLLAWLIFVCALVFFWFYVGRPFVQLLRNVPNARMRWSALWELYKHAAPYGVVLGLVLMSGNFLRFPPEWDATPMLAVFIIYLWFREYRGPAISDAIKRLDV